MTTIHLLPADDASQLGSGTSTDPYRVLPDPDDFDQRCQWIDRRSSISRVLLREGLYRTRGAWAHPNRCQFSRSITVEGVGETYIELSDPITQKDSNGVESAAIMVFGNPNQNNGRFVVRNLLLTATQASFGNYVTAGLWIAGNNATVSGVKVDGLRGSMSKGHETFGILTNNRPDGFWGQDPPYERDGGLLIRDCTVYINAGDDAYDSGIHIGHLESDGALLQPTVVERCQVIGTGAKPARVAFAFGSRVTFRDCYASNVTYAVYNDTAHASDVLFERLLVDRLDYCAMAIHRIAESYPGWKRNITVADSTFRYTPRNEWGALTVWDKTPSADQGDFRRILMRDCVFEGPADARQPFFAMALDAVRAEEIDLRNCSLPLSAQQHRTARSPKLQLSRLGIPLGPYRPLPRANELRGEVEMPRPEGGEPERHAS